MNTVRYLWLVFALFGCSAADNCEICILTDVECMTKGAVTVYASVLAGASGYTLDPLCIKQIHSKEGSSEYNITDIELIGLSACTVTKLDVNVNETIYKHYVYCPKLISIFRVKIKDATHQEDHNCHQLHLRVTGHDYESANVGDYVILVGDNDFRPHVLLQNVHPTVTLKGELTFETLHHVHVTSQSKNSHDCHKCKDVIEFINSLIVQRAMKIVMMGGIQAYCKDHNMSELFPKSKPKKSCGNQIPT